MFKPKNFQNTKERVARILATENIDIIWGNFKTASFDLVKRELRIPIFKENISENLVTTFICHEIGHALYTRIPNNKFSFKKYSSKERAYINVFEDMRIEKLIKLKYPGSIIYFESGYNELLKRNFFGEISKFSTYIFINRLNIKSKCNDLVDNISFSDFEQKIINKIYECNSFKEIIDYAVYIANDNKLNNNSETSAKSDDDDTNSKVSDDDDTNSKVSDDDDINSEVSDDDDTNSIEEQEKDIHEYLFEFEKIIYHKQTINSAKDYLNKFEFDFTYKNNKKKRSEAYIKFKNRYNISINNMITEFNMRKSAHELAKTQYTKTGILNPIKLHSYKFDNNIFKNIEIISHSENHGISILLDYSSSMAGVNLKMSFLQIAIIVEFCFRQKIKFQVFGFTTRDGYYVYNGKLSSSIFLIVNSYMSHCDIKDRIGGILNMSRGKNMGGTPLTEALVDFAILTKDFKESESIEKMHAVILTDGESQKTFLNVNTLYMGGIGTFKFGLNNISKNKGTALNDIDKLYYIMKEYNVVDSITAYYIGDALNKNIGVFSLCKDIILCPHDKVRDYYDAVYKITKTYAKKILLINNSINNDDITIDKLKRHKKYNFMLRDFINKIA